MRRLHIGLRAIAGLLVLGLCLVELSAPAQAQIADEPWPTFGQNLQRTGQTPNDTTTGDWNVNPGAATVTPPTIGPDGQVFIARDDGSGTLALEKYAATDGSQLLQTTTLTGTPVGQPAIVGDTALVPTIASGIGYLDVFQGVLGGPLDVVANIGLTEAQNLSPPTVDARGKAYIMVDQQTNSDSLFAVELDSGSIAWTVGVDSANTAVAPAIQDDGTILVAGGRGTLYAVPPDGGTVDTLYDATASSPALDSLNAPAIAGDGTIYLTGGGAESPGLVSVGSDGTENWTQTFGAKVTSPVVGPGEVVHLADSTGAVYAFDSGGTKKWEKTAENPIQAPPVVDGNGAVYVGTQSTSATPSVIQRFAADGLVEWSISLDAVSPAGLALAADRTVYVSRPGQFDFPDLFSLQILGLSGLDPGANETVSTTQDLSASFTEPMDDLPDIADSIVVGGSQSGPIDGSVSGVETRTLTYSPSTAFAPGETVTVTLLGSLKDVRGAPFQFPFTFQLWAEAGAGPAAFPVDSVVTTSANGARALHAADVTGSGSRDLVVGSEIDSTLSWFENQGSAHLGGENVIADGLDHPRDVTTADMDGDGDLDVVVAVGENDEEDGSQDVIAWYANDGTATFGDSTEVAPAGGDADDIRAIAVGDLDGNGAPDVVGASDDGGGIYGWLNDGTGQFGSATFLADVTDPRAVALADLNHTGALDLVWTDVANNVVKWKPNSGRGDFGSARTITGSRNGPTDLDIGDLNGDGRPDVLVASENDDTVAAYDTTSTGWTETVITTSADSVQSVHAADVDGTGGLDVLAASAGDHSVRVFLNDGTGAFPDTTVIDSTAEGAQEVIASDLDGDGDLDPAAASYRDDTVAFYLNRLFPPTAGRVRTRVQQGVKGRIDVLSAVESEGDAQGVLDSSSVRVERDPLHGTATVAADGTVEYTHDGSDQLADSLAYSVADIDGRRSNEATVRLDVVSIAAAPTDDPQRGMSVPMEVTVEGSGELVGQDLFARRGGTTPYTRIALQQEESSNQSVLLSGLIPDSLVTEQGVDYYVVLTDETATYAVPGGKPARAAARPSHVPVTFDSLQADIRTKPETYGMISVPARSTSGIKSALEQAYGLYDAAKWRLLRWDPAEGRYREYPQIESIGPGEGYWLITENGEPFVLGDGRTVDASGPKTVVLRPGWNQLGNPFGFAVPWDSVLTASGFEAVDVDGPVAYRDSGGYRYDQSRLRPWEGYFVRNPGSEPDTLVVPPVGMGASTSVSEQTTGPKALAGTGALGAPARREGVVGHDRQRATRSRSRRGNPVPTEGGDAATDEAEGPIRSSARNASSETATSTPENKTYTVRVAAWPQDADPHSVWLGLHPDAEPGRDALDFAQAPPIDQTVRLSVREPRGQTEVPHAGSFKPGDGDGAHWHLLLENQREESTPSVKLRIQAQGQRPEGHQRYLLDLDRGERMAPGRTLTLEAREQRRLKVIVGTKAYAQQESDGISIERFENEVRGNYPNPFERATTLEYVLASSQEVTVGIYNILGQRVQTLTLGPKKAGVHTVRWEGKNRYGEPVGSGVYFYRVETEDFTKTRKMVLVR